MKPPNRYKPRPGRTLFLRLALLSLVIPRLHAEENKLAFATSHDEEEHHPVYLSLFGRDFKTGESAAAPARLVIGRNFSDDKAVALHARFVQDLKHAD